MNHIKLLLVCVLGALFIYSATPAPSQAYLSVTECRSTLTGKTGDNEVKMGWNVALDWGFTPVKSSWDETQRISNTKINQWIRYTDWRGTFISYRGVCSDLNNSGQIGIHEDWIATPSGYKGA